MEYFPGTYGCDGVMRRRCGEEGVWYNEQDCRAGGKIANKACVSPCFEVSPTPTAAVTIGLSTWTTSPLQDGAAQRSNLADVATDITVTDATALMSSLGRPMPRSFSPVRSR